MKRNISLSIMEGEMFLRTPTKQLNNLTLLDRFLFASVMEDKRWLELAIYIILG